MMTSPRDSIILIRFI